MAKPAQGRGARAIEKLFLDRYKPGAREIPFERDDLQHAADALKIVLPKNPGAVIYDYRYRTSLPPRIREKAPKTRPFWIIRGRGKAKYAFVAVKQDRYEPRQDMEPIKVLDSTPQLIAQHAFDDEQATLAKLRYNRLIDLFTGVACHSLQNHLRTSMKDVGQLETDELYIGTDKHGCQYVFPVQAKGKNDKLGVVQVLQDFELCELKFPSLVCRPIGAQTVKDRATKEERIVLFEFAPGREIPSVRREAHYRLVAKDEIDEAELADYRRAAAAGTP